MRFTASSLGRLFPALPGRAESYDRGHRSGVCFLQHKHFLGSRFRRLSDALNGAAIRRVEYEVGFENCSMVLPTMLNG
jgi:hypothetical protein